MKAMTLNDLESMNKNMLTPKEASEFLHCNPYFITQQARKDPKVLGFPVVIIGSRTRIPREAFIRFMKGDLLISPPDRTA